MGCDIHLMLERRLKEDEKIIVSPEQKDENGNVTRKEISYINDSKEWRHCSILGYNSVWSERTYGMFAKLADVRNYWEDTIKPIEYRGFPDDATQKTVAKYGYLIQDTDPKDEETEDNWSEWGYIGATKAKKWVNDYNCNVIKKDGMSYVQCPDWHSPNWCTTQEMEDAVNEIFFKDGKLGGDYIEWVALVGAMKGYEQSGKYECRAVFWFDN